jgi:hypothetical protein
MKSFILPSSITHCSFIIVNGIKEDFKLNRIITIVLVLALAFSFAACGKSGGNSGGSTNSQSSNTDTPPVSTSSGGNSENAAQFPDSNTPLAEAVGVTTEGKRLVKQTFAGHYLESIAPKGTTMYYTTVEFDGNGMFDNTWAVMWYVFDDADAYKAALDVYLKKEDTFFYFASRSDAHLYYSFRTGAGFRNTDSDGNISFASALAEWEKWLNPEIETIIDK